MKKPTNLRKLKMKGTAYLGIGMLVEAPDLNCEFLVVANRHEDMQRAATRLGIKYDTRKARNLKITQQ